MQVTFHFDPSCPWTWLTSRWLVRAAEVEDLELRWAPFSLPHLSDASEVPEQFRGRTEMSRAATRVVQHLATADDHDAIARFYDALGDVVHRGGDEATAAVAVDAARAAGLDDHAVAAAGDPSLDAAVDAVTDTAYDHAGPDVGSPVLHWTDDHGQDVWIFGPLFDEVMDPPCAAEMWRGVRALAVHPWFKELKRGRSGPADLRGS